MNQLQVSSGAKTKCWAMVKKVGGSNLDEDISFLELVELREGKKKEAQRGERRKKRGGGGGGGG